MNLNITLKNNYTQILLTIVALVLAVFLVSMHHPEFLSIDSAQYISVAKNILIGEGFSTDILYYEKQYQQEILPAAQTIFPPGYSILIAIASLLGPDLIEASFWVNLFCFLGSMLLIFKILLACDYSARVSMWSALLWAAFSVNWHYVLISMSEIPFIFILLLSLYLLIKYETNRRWLWIICASVLLGFAFWVRYAGLFFIIAISIYQFYNFWKNKDKTHFLQLVLYHVITYSFVIFLFARNYYYLGEISGGPKLNNGGAIFQLIQNMYWSLNKLIGADSGGGFYQILRVTLMVFISYTAYLIIKHRTRFEQFSIIQRKLLLLICLMLLSYMGSLFAMAYKFEGDFINIRYLIPVLPLVSILLVVLFDTVSRMVVRKRLYNLLMAVVMVAFFGAQLIIAQDENKWLSSVKERFSFVTTMSQQQMADGRLVSDLLNTVIDTQHPVLAPRGQVIAALLDIPLIGLTQQKFTHRTWDEAEVKNIVNQYQVSFLLLPLKSYDRNLAGNRNQILFNRLYDGDRFEWLTPVVEQQDFILFAVN